MVLPYHRPMAGRPSDVDLEVADDQGQPVQREGHETLLPSVTRSALSTKIPVIKEARLDPSGFQDISETPRPPRPDERPRGARAGDVIGGRYVVEGQLGRGGMGRVMRVQHSALGKVFALKLIKSSIATNPRIREMFYREARLASALTHDNICSIVDFGQDEAFGLFMVMELLEGQTVHGKLKQGRLSPKVACDVLWQVADAVRFIHSRAIVHGDIKTENIFLVKTALQRRLVKLLDFGLARPELGRSEGVDGTPEYLAPERQDGAPASQASDIYALGIVFFELLTGRVPFTGAATDVMLHHKLTPVPAPSTQLGEPLDERADALVARATAKDPAQRHPDVPALLYELRALMGMLGMDQGRRRTVPAETRERRDLDHRVKAAAEVFGAVAIPMASCDPSGRVRAANPAFLEFLGVAGDAAGLQLRDSALLDLYPGLFRDLEEVVAKRRPIKRLLYLHEGGDRVIEAAILLSAAPATAEVTAGEIHLVVHPLRAITG
ncbi:MAG: PAS domain-containing protein [Deltaproteobacteria bacterium]|nr:MAG: PAS domain-containing protein [Deltaproteobacteria bacterium]